MNGDKSKSADAKSKPASATPTPAKAPPPAPPPIKPPPPLFRTLDWITFGVTTLLVFVGYYLTLAPDLTLEDSGELAVGSFYAGVPHPPGYPVWTIYTWLFTHIPYSNIAWRVALSSAVAGAFACGLLALMVSRGSSLMLESIADFKNIERRWENALCVVSGFVSGMLLAFNGFMWSQAVIVEVYTLSVLSLMGVLCCLFRWIYAPEQRRYLYWAVFWFGICVTNHQTLIVAAMGIEIAVLAARPSLGRDMFIGNSAIYLAGIVLKGMGILTAFDTNPPLFVIYNLVGVGSIVTAAVMTFKTGRALTEWLPVIIMALVWFLGASFYFYMPLASMTNPPMNWGYPRTEEGFWHALTRGQYEQANPTSDPGRLFGQLWMYVEGATDEFGLVYLLIGVIPFLFYFRMQKREQAWLIGLTAIWLGLAILLLILLNPNTDKQSREQARVFFTASHVILAVATGYGITMIGGLLSACYERWRFSLLVGGAIASAWEFYSMFLVFDKTQLPTVRYAAVLALALAVLFTLTVLLARVRASMPVFLALFALIPGRSILAQWSDNEQRGHLFGYWFGHDMFTPPFTGPDGKLTYDRKLREEMLKKPEGKSIYPEMTRDTVLFGGTDPGRFNPTYMIFCESFIPPANKPRDPEFDRRDVYLITQNALADKTYLDYIRAHYNRSAQSDPYFFSELLRSEKETTLNRTNLLAKAALPLDRYFTDLGAKIEQRRRAEGVYPRKEILTPSNDDLNKAFQDYIGDAARRLQHDRDLPNEPKQVKQGEGVTFTKDGRVQVSGQIAVMSINALLTKVIFDKNPDHEFFIEESFPLDWMFPYLTPFGIIMKINRQPIPEITEEIVQRDHEFWSKYSERLIGNWITYDTSVKEICDFAERTFLRHDFTGFTGDRKFVRDDFAQKAFSKLRSAIGWIYGWRIGYECLPDYRPKTPAEQQRLAREAEFALKQSYAFCPFSPEALHKYITLLLSANRVQDAQLVAETTLKFDPGNPVFLSYANQLRAFSGNQKQVAQVQDQFAQLEKQFRDSPTNLSLGLQLVSTYMQVQRPDAAIPLLDVIRTSSVADVQTLLSVAQSYAQLGQRTQLDATIQRLQKLLPPLREQYQTNTNNIPLAFQLASGYLATQQTNLALELVDELAARPQADGNTLLSASTVYHQLQNWTKLEATLQKLVAVVPTNPEAWYDLAALQAMNAKIPEASAALQKAIQLSRSRLATQPNARDLQAEATRDGRFGQLRQQPALQPFFKTN